MAPQPVFFPNRRLSKAEGIMVKEKLKLDGRFQSIVSKFQITKYYN
jgi:hypothetical protein